MHLCSNSSLINWVTLSKQANTLKYIVRDKFVVISYFLSFLVLSKWECGARGTSQDPLVSFSEHWSVFLRLFWPRKPEGQHKGTEIQRKGGKREKKRVNPAEAKTAEEKRGWSPSSRGVGPIHLIQIFHNLLYSTFGFYLNVKFVH